MLNTHACLRTGRATRCAVCDGKFGLVRHYSWRTPLCSTKSVDRLRCRRQSDCKWVGWLHIAFYQPQDNTARTLLRAAQTMTGSVLKALVEDSNGSRAEVRPTR